jgi:hypothetical protein
MSADFSVSRVNLNASVLSARAHEGITNTVKPRSHVHVWRSVLADNLARSTIHGDRSSKCDVITILALSANLRIFSILDSALL